MKGYVPVAFLPHLPAKFKSNPFVKHLMPDGFKSIPSTSFSHTLLSAARNLIAIDCLTEFNRLKNPAERFSV
jgi:hypothetical protein